MTMTPLTSRIPGFYNLPLAERLEALRAAGAAGARPTWPR